MTWKVDICESERGWGQRLDETCEFTNYQEALEFSEDFNSKNTQDTVPDWYLYAGKPYI